MVTNRQESKLKEREREKGIVNEAKNDTGGKKMLEEIFPLLYWFFFYLVIGILI